LRVHPKPEGGVGGTLWAPESQPQCGGLCLYPHARHSSLSDRVRLQKGAASRRDRGRGMRKFRSECSDIRAVSARFAGHRAFANLRRGHWARTCPPEPLIPCTPYKRRATR
jgi:hypothetical protein